MKNLAIIVFLSLSVCPFAFAQEPPPGTDLMVTKTGPAEAAAGSDVTYTVTVTNISSVDAPDVTLTDPVPADMTFVSATGPAPFTCALVTTSVVCDGGSLAAGASATFTIVLNIDSDAAPGTTFTNQATATVTEIVDEDEENNTGVAVTTTPFPPTADLAVTKSAPPSAGPDTDVTFSIVLTNAGPSAATTVVLTDNLPAPLTFVSFTQISGPTFSCGTSSCTIASLPAGATATFELTGHVPAGTQAGTEITNTATVTSDDDPNDENDSSSTTVVVASADVSVVKSGPGSVTAGTNVSYTITVTNNGPDTALGITLTDLIPAGTTFVSLTPVSGPQGTCTADVYCSFDSLISGQSSQYTLVVRAGDTTSITNTATVTAQSYDPDPADNSSSVTTTVTPEADLAVSKTGAAAVTAGTNITWTVTLSNAGPSTAQNVTLTDTLPAGTTFVSVAQTSGPAFSCGQAAGVVTCTRSTFAPLASATFDITTTVALTTTGSVTNTASSTTATNDQNTANNSAIAVTTVNVAPADVSIVKTADAASYFIGATAVYTLVATNNGPGAAQNVVVTDVLPAGVTLVSAPGCTGTTTLTCPAGTLAASATATFTITVTVPSAPATLTNTAQVSSTTPDPNTANNTSTLQVSVGIPPADLSITKTANAPELFVGSTVVYTVSVLNNGPGPAENVVVTDVLPAGVTLVSAPGCTGTTTLTCNAGTLAAGASATFTITVTLPSTPGTVTNTATVATTTTDPAGGNNSSSASINAVAVPAAIPTLSTWALLFMAAALAAIALRVR
jgi:uncharacterized repeat protein (TIGR01451 family)